jgi:hypothetical protein
MTIRAPVLSTLVLATALAACSDGNGPSGTDATVDLHIGVAGTGAATVGAGGPLAAETIELGGNTLVLTEVQLVLRKVALQRLAAGDACDDETEEAAESDSENEADDDATCSVLKMGPVLVSLPLDGATSRLFAIDAEPGTFHRLMFQLHKPSNAGGDAAFLALNPAFDGVSVRVLGTFDGVPFEYLTDVTVVEHADLDPPLDVVLGTTSDLTLEVDLSGWFTDAAGTALIDPATIGTSVQLDAQIRQNIRTSFRSHPGHGTT